MDRRGFLRMSALAPVAAIAPAIPAPAYATGGLVQFGPWSAPLIGEFTSEAIMPLDRPTCLYESLGELPSMADFKALAGPSSMARWGENWSVPAGEWKGETAFILGGGPSLKGMDLSALPEIGPTIAIKHALRLAPWAECLLWADARWLEWDKAAIPDVIEHGAIWKVTTQQPPASLAGHVQFIAWSRRYLGFEGLSKDPAMLGGYASGDVALNLAFLMGASKIIMLGFDMHGGHWHEGKAESGDGSRARMIATFEKMAPALSAAGCQVINATPGSALQCFPVMSLDEALR